MHFGIPDSYHGDRSQALVLEIVAGTCALS